MPLSILLLLLVEEEALSGEVDESKVFAVGVRSDGVEGGRSVCVGHRHALDGILGAAGHHFHHLAVAGKDVGDFSDSVHAGVDEFDAVEAVLVRNDVHGRRRGEARILGFQGRMGDRALAAVAIGVADNHRILSGNVSGPRGGDLIAELTSDLGDIAVLAEVQSDLPLRQVLGTVDERQRIEAENVGLNTDWIAD